ncbi:hypothetical protein T310_9171, partial [Rasamsonia emersonii CBS 393.64]
GSEYPGETLDAQIIATNVSSHTPLYIPFLWTANCYAGILRLLQTRLLGLQLHRPPDKLVHGGQDRHRRPAPGDLRRRRGTLARGVHSAAADAFRGDPTGAPKTRRV